MTALARHQDMVAVTAEMPWKDRLSENSLFEMLSSTAAKRGDAPALTFQIRSGPKDKAVTLSWAALKDRVAQAANVFRGLGIDEDGVVAFLLPNCNEAVVTLLGAATAGKVCPINPTLMPDQIAALLRESGASVLVTLAPFPKAEVADLAVAALEDAPDVKHVLSVDLKGYLAPPVKWIVPLIRPKTEKIRTANVQDFEAALNKAPKELSFKENGDRSRICALFHTGGTTGMPKLVQHAIDGMLYNGWAGNRTAVSQDDVLMCPLPMFHVFAALPILMSSLVAGAHIVMPTPAGYRGDGVFDNFWKLVERWGVTFMITVPTAAAALMQRPVDADVSSLKFAFCGSAPLPVELFKRFEASTGVKILEGYGMSETTCLISGNPPGGDPKIGSVGLPFPYTRVRILQCDDAGNIIKACEASEVGEICVSSPGVQVGRTYTDPKRNEGLYADEVYLRTGDLGKLDPDGYLWITGRKKDLIIRGGHNIDPGSIEEAMMAHPQVSFAGAIGQPDAYAGELPCVYVELIDDADVTEEALLKHAAASIPDRTAVPKYLEVVDMLPKTAVGKVWKPEIRKLAIKRVFDETLEAAGLDAIVDEVVEVKNKGLVAMIDAGPECTDARLTSVLGAFPQFWQRVEQPSEG